MGIAAPNGLVAQSDTPGTVELRWHDGDTYDKVLVAWGLGNDASDPVDNQVDVDAASAKVAGFGFNSYTISDIDTTPGRSYVFKVKGGTKSDIFGAGITWDYTDWNAIIWVVPEVQTNPPFGSSTEPVVPAPVIIYGIVQDGLPTAGNLLWYLHLGAADGTDLWKTAAAPIAAHWEFKQAFSGGQGVIYAVAQDGSLQWFRHLGAAQGTPGLVTSSDPKGYIGEGWNFQHVFSGGNGIIYAVNAAGNLLWYRHLGFEYGTDKWQTTPDKKGYIGEGWNFQHVFSGGNGIIYAVNGAGNLLWYRHLGFEDGTDKWQTTPETKGYIGEGWNFQHVFSGGNGIIYAVNAAGNLLWYRHLGFEDGTDRWQTTSEKKGYVGEGWNFRLVFSGEAVPDKIA
jgi:hypothetical protein